MIGCQNDPIVDAASLNLGGCDLAAIRDVLGKDRALFELRSGEDSGVTLLDQVWPLDDRHYVVTAMTQLNC